MGFVYIIAFDTDGRFLMVRNRKRAWEMPGGKMEPGETPTQAVIREFLEETGYEIELGQETLNAPDGTVFWGRMGKKVGEPIPEEIAEVAFFDELPKELSFPKVEYLKMLKMFRPMAN